MDLFVLFEDLYRQCTTCNRLTEKMRFKLKKLKPRARQLLVMTEKDGVPPLGVAVERGKYNIVKYLLEDAKADADHWCTQTLDTKKIVKMTPLMFVKDLLIARCLVENGAKLTAVTECRTPLHWQCHLKNDEIVEYLVAQGAAINVRMVNSDTLLHCCFHSRKLYKLFIDSDAYVNAQNNGKQTPLHCAIIKGHFWAIEMLVQNGADPTIKYDNDTDAMRLACWRMDHHIVDYLATYGDYSDTDRANTYELLGGLYALNIKLVKSVQCWEKALNIRLNNGKFLKKKRCKDVDVTPPYKDAKEFVTMDELNAVAYDHSAMLLQTFLIYSRVLGPHKEETTKCLIELSASYARSSEFHKYYYPLQYSLGLAYKKRDNWPSHLEKVCTVCNLVFLISAENKRTSGKHFDDAAQLVSFTTSTLSKAVSSINYHFLIALLNEILKTAKTCQQQEKLTKLVKFVVRKDLRDEDGYTLLHFASYKSQPEENAHEGVTDHPAIEDLGIFEFPRVPVINLLIECGQEVDCLTKNGSTPLHFACEINDDEIVKCLLANGAHIDRVNARGFRAIDAMEEPMKYDSLKCLAARTIVKLEVPYKHVEFPALAEFIEMHKFNKVIKSL